MFLLRDLLNFPKFIIFITQIEKLKMEAKRLNGITLIFNFDLNIGLA